MCTYARLPIQIATRRERSSEECGGNGIQSRVHLRACDCTAQQRGNRGIWNSSTRHIPGERKARAIRPPLAGCPEGEDESLNQLRSLFAANPAEGGQPGPDQKKRRRFRDRCEADVPGAVNTT